MSDAAKKPDDKEPKQRSKKQAYGFGFGFWLLALALAFGFGILAWLGFSLALAWEGKRLLWGGATAFCHLLCLLVAEPNRTFQC